MTKTEFDPDALIDASLPLLGIELGEESRAGVRLNLRVAENLSKLVRDFPLDDDCEPAAVFTA